MSKATDHEIGGYRIDTEYYKQLRDYLRGAQQPSYQESVSNQPLDGFSLDGAYYKALRNYYRGEPYDPKYAPQEQPGDTSYYIDEETQ